MPVRPIPRDVDVAYDSRRDPAMVADGDGPIRRVEPTITALWAAVNVLQEDVAELQREIFQEGEE